MTALLGLLEVTTQGLFEALQQSPAWRTLHDSRRSIGAYAISLERFHNAQSQRDKALHSNSYWALTQMEKARQLPALESDLALLGLPVNGEKDLSTRNCRAADELCSGFHGFVAAFYVDEQLRLMHDAMGCTIPWDWPRQYICGSALRYRWPQVLDCLNHRLMSRVDALEVAWLAQEHLVGMVEVAGDFMSERAYHTPAARQSMWQSRV